MKKLWAKQKLKSMTMFILMSAAILMLMSPITGVNAEDLCERITSGQLSELKLQSMTYLQNHGTDKIYLLSDLQWYELSAEHISKEGKNPLTAKDEKFWDSEPLLKQPSKGNSELATDPDPMNLFSVFHLDKSWFGMGANDYYALLRTSAKVHVATLTDGSGFPLTKSFSAPNIYPHFTLIVKQDSDNTDERGYIVQNDNLFDKTGSPVFYLLGLNDKQEPRLAMALSDTQEGGSGLSLETFYLISKEDNPKEVTVMSTWLDRAKAVAMVKESPLLHRVPIGFVSPKGLLFLIEPVIGCVYTIDDFGGFYKTGYSAKLTRTPIEKFFRCSAEGGEEGSEVKLDEEKYPANRCDSPEKAKEFFASNTDEDSPPMNLEPGSTNATNGTDFGQGDLEEASLLSKLLMPGLIVLGIVLVLIVVIVLFVCLNGKKGKGKHGGKHGRKPHGGNEGTGKKAGHHNKSSTPSKHTTFTQAGIVGNYATTRAATAGTTRATTTATTTGNTTSPMGTSFGTSRGTSTGTSMGAGSTKKGRK